MNKLRQEEESMVSSQDFRPHHLWWNKETYVQMKEGFHEPSSTTQKWKCLITYILKSLAFLLPRETSILTMIPHILATSSFHQQYVPLRIRTSETTWAMAPLHRNVWRWCDQPNVSQHRAPVPLLPSIPIIIQLELHMWGLPPPQGCGGFIALGTQ